MLRGTDRREEMGTPAPTRAGLGPAGRPPRGPPKERVGPDNDYRARRASAQGAKIMITLEFSMTSPKRRFTQRCRERNFVDSGAPARVQYEAGTPGRPAILSPNTEGQAVPRILAPLLLAAVPLTALLAALAGEARAQQGDRRPPPSLPAVREAMSRSIAAHEIAGAVTLVANADRVLGLDAVGQADIAADRPMKPDTIFWIAS